jgi:hypothetical protein
MYENRIKSVEIVLTRGREIKGNDRVNLIGYTIYMEISQ